MTAGRPIVKELLGRKRAEGVSEQTVAKIRRHMHAMFAFAQDAGLVSVNPAAAPRKRGQKERRRARGTALSAVQIAGSSMCARRVGGCSSRSRSTRGCVAASWSDSSGATSTCATGCCMSGAASATTTTLAEVLTTKTEAGERLVPILDGAQAALEALRADAVDTDDAAPVFATVERKRGQDGVMRPVGRPLSPRMVSRVFRRYAERAGLPDDPTARPAAHRDHQRDRTGRGHPACGAFAGTRIRQPRSTSTRICCRSGRTRRRKECVLFPTILPTSFHKRSRRAETDDRALPKSPANKPNRTI